MEYSNNAVACAPVIADGTVRERGRKAFVEAFEHCGLRQGDIVFWHVSLGDLSGNATAETLGDEILLSAMQEVVGDQGMIVLPAFSFSFENNEGFDIISSPAVGGKWSKSLGFLEHVRTLPISVRSKDPNWSVVAIGPSATRLLQDLPANSFGKGSVYERLLELGAKICCIGGRLSDSPFIHFIEETAGAPTRYKKLSTGLSTEGPRSVKQGWITTVATHPNGDEIPDQVEQMLRSDRECHAARLGATQVLVIGCRRYDQLLRSQLETNPRITTPSTSHLSDFNSEPVNVDLSPDATCEELIEKLWRLPRDIVSDGYDVALRALSTQMPMTIHEYPTGMECSTWLVPEKWTCHEARLETIDGRRLFSYADHPLHVVSYSLPINKEVSRDELFKHLHVHPELPDAVPFVFNYYERDWGLCCSRDLKESLREERYRVVIDTKFTNGSLKVGEVVVPGHHDNTFVLCSHLCHPAMVNDDLSGVVVGLKVIQQLAKRSNLRYTYRLLILPETIGSVAYLSNHQNLIPKMIGGLFLEMLGLENPHALQLSFRGDTDIDECCISALRKGDASGWTGAFRTVVGNDERQFNAPGVRVPMLSLSRVMRDKAGLNPYYPQYHSSHDNPDLASPARLQESCDLVLRMIDAIEESEVPINCYQGEIFCSRYGLNIDAYASPEANRAFFDIIFQVDGTKSVSQIARSCKVSEDSVRIVLGELRKHGLITYRGETSLS